MASVLERIVAVKPLTPLEADYQKTMILLAALKSGEITIDDFYLVPNGWMFGKQEEQAPTAE